MKLGQSLIHEPTYLVRVKYCTHEYRQVTRTDNQKCLDHLSYDNPTHSVCCITTQLSSKQDLVIEGCLTSASSWGSCIWAYINPVDLFTIVIWPTLLELFTALSCQTSKNIKTYQPYSCFLDQSDYARVCLALEGPFIIQFGPFLMESFISFKVQMFRKRIFRPFLIRSHHNSDNAAVQHLMDHGKMMNSGRWIKSALHDHSTC